MKLKNLGILSLSKDFFILRFSLFIIYFSLIFFGCNSEKPVCPHCTGDDDQNEISAMVANISGCYNCKFDSESFEYHSYNYNEYKLREIVAKMYIDTAYLEIRLTFNDYSDNNKTYDFASDKANASITIYSIPPEYFQYNIIGSITISEFNDNDISATFELSCTTTDENRKLSVNQGVIYFKKNK
ncbi:MAG: hypothetical protein V1779_13985 [bacterium]